MSQHQAPATTDWRHTANCRDLDPDLFFPLGESLLFQQQIREAKDACLCCDVSAACLDWALETGQDAGIWGGLTESERRLKRREMSRA